VLVIIVVFVFLQGWRATLIPLLAVPVSLVGTFMLFPMFGFSINTLSLFGLVLAIGLVVDDAIVVVEAVEHHIEQGLSPKDATLKAMEEVTGPVIAIAVILAAVFVPTAFIPGITGQLYQQFAVTIAISVIISAFNALTLSPALCAMLLRPKGQGQAARCRSSTTGSMRCSAGSRSGYVGICRLAIRKSFDQPRLPVGDCRQWPGSSARRARRLPAGRRPGLRLCRRPASRCLVAAHLGDRPPGRGTHHGRRA
jgi:HAE1 family hydrophobic/amphiphilic exporter-1